MKYLLIIASTLLLMCLEDVQSGLHVSTPFRMKTSPRVRLFGDIELKQLENYRLPSPQLCKELKASEQVQLALPWWSHYCGDLRERELKNYQNADRKNKGNMYQKYHNPYYKHMLSQFNDYKKKIDISKRFLESIWK